MCGRFGLTQDVEDLQGFFPFSVTRVPFKPRFNIAPTDPVLVYRENDDQAAEYMRWGLVPWFAKPNAKLPLAINAKMETIATNGMFKSPFERKRCLVLSDGFYEWETLGKVKKPYRIGLKSWEPFAFAGLWERWRNRETNEETLSCTIITCPPNELIEPIHDRMPVILPRERWDAWLDRDTKGGQAQLDLLVPYPADDMAMYACSPLVNSVANDVPEVVEPA